MLTNKEQRVVKSVAPDYLEKIAIGAAQIPSYADPIGTEQAIAEYFGKALKAIGCEVELQEVRPSRPNVIARLKGGTSGKKVLFNGHIDTAPPVMGWGQDPLGGKRDGDRLYGHGISNMKASCAAMVAAARAVADADANFPGELILSLVMGECAGGTGTKTMVERGIEADYFINGEPTDLRVLTMHSGICRLQIKVSGRSHGFAVSPGKGINAIEKMMRILHELGPSLRRVDWIKNRVEKPDYDGLPRYNLGVIHGGLTKDLNEWGPYNTPDYCVATLDIRHPPGVTAADVKDDLDGKLREIAQDDTDIHAIVELMPEFCMIPWEVGIGDYVVETMKDAAEVVTGRAPDVGALSPIKFMGGDAGCLQAAGIPGVMCGVGFFTTSVPDEYVEVSKMLDVAKMYSLAAYRVATGEPVNA